MVVSPVNSSECFPELIRLENLPDDESVENDDGHVGDGLDNDQLHPHLKGKEKKDFRYKLFYTVGNADCDHFRPDLYDCK
jgi:hypothetical protein